MLSGSLGLGKFSLISQSSRLMQLLNHLRQYLTSSIGRLLQIPFLLRIGVSSESRAHDALKGRLGRFKEKQQDKQEKLAADPLKKTFLEMRREAQIQSLKAKKHWFAGSSWYQVEIDKLVDDSQVKESIFQRRLRETQAQSDAFTLIESSQPDFGEKEQELAESCEVELPFESISGQELSQHLISSREMQSVESDDCSEAAKSDSASSYGCFGAEDTLEIPERPDGEDALMLLRKPLDVDNALILYQSTIWTLGDQIVDYYRSASVPESELNAMALWAASKLPGLWNEYMESLKVSFAPKGSPGDQEDVEAIIFAPIPGLHSELVEDGPPELITLLLDAQSRMRSANVCAVSACA